MTSEAAQRRATSLRIQPLTGPTVALFPGQGSQVEGMRDRVRAYCPDLYVLVQELLGEDPFDSAESSTRMLQPAIYCASIAGWRIAQEKSSDWRHPDAFAGHSLGEIAALAAAGTISHDDGLRLVILRGRLMEQMAGVGRPGGMLAILGLGIDAVARFAARDELSIAGHNAPGQTVVSGDLRRLELLAAELELQGIDARLLPIRGAFHSPAMEPIRETLEIAVRKVRFHDQPTPVFSSVTGERFDDIPVRLGQSLTSTVQWTETVTGLYAAGARQFIEMGPGKKLTRLVKRTLEGVSACTVDTWDGTWAARSLPSTPLKRAI